MYNFFNKKTTIFILVIALLFFVLFLDFLFFYPKFGSPPEYTNLRSLGQKDITETETLFFNNLEPGDIVADRPISFIDSYKSTLEEGSILTNIFIFFFYYNLFDKVFVNSMGEDGYWHVYIYTGNKTLNSLDFKGVNDKTIDSEFFETKYLEILKVNTEKKYKEEAVKQAKMHLQNKDISYSLKNGVIVVFTGSTGLIPFDNLEENKLVCSSYLALVYKEISFNPYKHFIYISPADIDNSELTETVFLKNEKGVYIK